MGSRVKFNVSCKKEKKEEFQRSSFAEIMIKRKNGVLSKKTDGDAIKTF